MLAVDRSAKRLKRLEENLARLKLAAATRAIDAEQLDKRPSTPSCSMRPCSATGTIRRHPDVAWTKGEEDVKKLAGLQARLLDKAAGLLKPGRAARLLHLLAGGGKAAPGGNWRAAGLRAPAGHARGGRGPLGVPDARRRRALPAISRWRITTAAASTGSSWPGSSGPGDISSARVHGC